VSRSRRKTPIVGMTTIESDKWFKAKEHRRERAAIRAAMANDDELPDPKEFGNPWASGKDGKQYWPDPRAYRK
jgi:hypothetical protein